MVDFGSEKSEKQMKYFTVYVVTIFFTFRTNWNLPQYITVINCTVYMHEYTFVIENSDIHSFMNADGIKMFLDILSLTSSGRLGLVHTQRRCECKPEKWSLPLNFNLHMPSVALWF